MALAILGVTGFTGRLVLDEARRAGLDVRLVGRRREALEELADVRGGGARCGRHQVRRGRCSVRRLRRRPLVCRPVPGDRDGAGARCDRGRRSLSRHERRAGVGEALARARRERRPGARAGVRVRLRAGRHRGAAGRRAGGWRRSTSSSSRTRSRASARAGGRGGRSATCSGRGRSPGRTAGSCRPGSARRPAACAFRSASERSSSGAGPSRSRCRGTRTSAMCARTFARRALAGTVGSLGRLAAPFVRAVSRFGPAGPSPESRRKSRFAVVAEARGPAGEGRAVVEGSDVYGLTAALLVRGAQMLIAGEATGLRRARTGRGVRRADARRTARAVPHDR